MSKFLEVCKKLCFFLLLTLTFFLVNVDAAFAHVPHDVISKLEISPVYDQTKTLFIVVRNNLLKSKDGGYSWKRIVKGLDNKHLLSSLAISSLHPNKFLFLSSDGDGIYKSQDEGSSWFKVNNGLGSLNIDLLSICTDYSDKVVFAAGTEEGLYKTINGGKSWYQVIDGGNKITAIASFSKKNEHILIGDRQGILHLSTDGGEVWRQSSQISNSGAITAIAVSPNFSLDNTLFIGTEKAGIFKTVNGGISFLKVNNGISDKHVNSLVMSPNYETDFTIFASAWNEGVFRSIDGGNTWDKYSKGLTTVSQADQRNEPHFKDLKISKTFGKDKTIFLGGYDGLFKSTDAGRVWKQMDTLSLELIVGLGLSPEYKNDSTVAITTYKGGAYKTTDEQGITWTAINKGLKQARLGDIVFSPNYRSDKTIFSTAENYLLKSTDRGKNWQKIKLSNEYWGLSKLVNTGSNSLSRWLPKWVSALVKPKEKPWPTMIAISPNFASDKTIYFGTRTGRIFRSTDGGLNCSVVWKEIGQQVKYLVISPDFSSDQTLYASVFGGEGVYKSVDGGNTWHSASNGLAFIKKGIELAISPHYKVDKTIFAGTLGGLFETTDAGKNWVKLVGYAYGRDGYIETIAISPNYESDRTFIVSVKGKGLFKTVNGGKTFAQIGTDLIDNNHALSNMDKFPPAAVAIKFSPLYSIDNTIYGSSAEELFQSTDGGNTWKTITTPIRYEGSRNVFERLIQFSDTVVAGLGTAAAIALGAYHLFKKKLKHLK